MLLIPALFYAIALSGYSFKSIALHGWLGSRTLPSTNYKFWKVWQLYNFPTWLSGGVAWRIAIRTTRFTVPLALVVAFGSSMDIAAIQSDVA